MAKALARVAFIVLNTLPESQRAVPQERFAHREEMLKLYLARLEITMLTRHRVNVECVPSVVFALVME